MRPWPSVSATLILVFSPLKAHGSSVLHMPEGAGNIPRLPLLQTRRRNPYAAELGELAPINTTSTAP